MKSVAAIVLAGVALTASAAEFGPKPSMSACDLISQTEAEKMLRESIVRRFSTGPTLDPKEGWESKCEYTGWKNVLRINLKHAALDSPRQLDKQARVIYVASNDVADLKRRGYAGYKVELGFLAIVFNVGSIGFESNWRDDYPQDYKAWMRPYAEKFVHKLSPGTTIVAD